MPNKIALQLHDLELVIVHFCDDLRQPLLVEQSELLREVDRLVAHVTSPFFGKERRQFLLADQPPQRLSRRAMKARRSNRCTSCSFLSSAPCSGGMSFLGSRSRKVSGAMSSTMRSLIQSSSSDVDGFFFSPGTSRIS